MLKIMEWEMIRLFGLQVELELFIINVCYIQKWLVKLQSKIKGLSPYVNSATFNNWFKSKYISVKKLILTLIDKPRLASRAYFKFKSAISRLEKQ